MNVSRETSKEVPKFTAQALKKLTKREMEAQHKAGVTETAPELQHEIKPSFSQVFQPDRGSLLQRLHNMAYPVSTHKLTKMWEYWGIYDYALTCNQRITSDYNPDTNPTSELIFFIVLKG